MAALHIAGTSFLAARLLYTYGMLRQPGSTSMVVAAGITYAIELVLLGFLFRAVI